MLKEVVVASAFGTSSGMDAFVIAFTVPAYLINVAAGSLNVALIPTYIAVRDNQDPDSASQLLSSALLLNIAILTVLALALAAGAPLVFDLVARGFAPDTRSLSMSMFFLLLPCVLISGISVTLEAVLNAGGKFLGAGLAPALIPLAVMAAVLTGAAELGAYSLVAGTIVGYLIELGFVFALLAKSRTKVSLRWAGFHPALKTVIHQYIPAVSGSSLMCSAVVIDQTMATWLGSGSVSALNYGNKLVAVMVGVGTMALGTAVLPFFSGLAARQDWGELRRTLDHYLWLIIATTVPATVAFVLFSEDITRLLYERGAFSAQDTAVVANIQAMLAVQIPFHTLGILFVRMLSSLKLNAFMFFSNIISVVLKIGLNYLFMQRWGIVGIALSTVCVYGVAALFMGWVVYRKLPRQSQTL